ncbi:MAG: insulinase family protein [Pseudomonadales bacterium]|nr:insulinase family protein [Pseudomonadales bacterium]MDP6471983.1 insulinase family protein [Pseudomonadales bacterium]MDP6826746.1 insulinase family protein [Pseudomonadales bacterium]MDP6971023.1 insulinase family protein [Pseudomonadales bacterium]
MNTTPWKAPGALILLTCLSACQSAQPPDASFHAGARSEVVVHKSDNDDRSYRYLELENRLRVLLVSDTETDKAAASLVAFRGSQHEPDAYPGLAHFLEHMLFIGTKKFPEVDGYQRFLASHGGFTNAYTATDHTNYFFEVQPEYLIEGLDRFSQFFISPLFEADYVDREKKAVASEYQMQFKADDWRVSAAQKKLMNPNHPASRFSIGNLDTLGEGVREALISFFEQNYSADQMALVVLGRQSLDDLEHAVVPLFSPIADRDIGSGAITVPLFADATLPVRLTVEPLKEIRSVTYDFPLPASARPYRKKPDAYVSNLLGHEGEGSLYSWLKDAGWIESLSAYSGDFDTTNSFITIDIDLTEEGVERIDDITSSLFAFIELLKSTPPDAWRYEEQAIVSTLGFRFQEKGDAANFVRLLASDVQRYAPGDLLRARYMMTEFDATAIENVLSFLTPKNMLMVIMRPDAASDEVEEYFEVPYAITPGSPPMVFLQPDLDLPPSNPFLPDTLDLATDDPALPALLQDGVAGRIWLDTDTSFGTPRANTMLSLHTAGGNATVYDNAAARLYARIVSDELNTFAYPAYLAGLHFSITPTMQGFEIRTSGYTDKQMVLLDAVIEAFATSEIDAVRFERFQHELVRNWRNFLNERPYTQAYDRLAQLVLQPRWSRPALAMALEAMSVEDLRTWREEHIGKHGLRALLHGNVTARDAQNLREAVTRHLVVDEIDEFDPVVVPIEGNYRAPISIDHSDAAMVLYIQDPDATFAARALSAFAVHLLRQPYFKELRTEQQLGYIVTTLNTTFRDQAGVGFIIQSPVASPRSLEDATVAFLDRQVIAIREMSDDDFAANREGLISELKQRDQNLGERSGRFWRDLDLDITTFDSRKQIARQVERIDQDTIQTFIAELARRVRNQRLIVYAPGKFDQTPESGTLIPATVNRLEHPSTR